MFWNNYVALCNERNEAPNVVAKKCGVKSTGTVTGWKNGSIPRQGLLTKLADYFGCATADLLYGNKNPATTDGDGNRNDSINDEQAYVTRLYNQLTFENKVRLVNELQSLLQQQSTQDDQ